MNLFDWKPEYSVGVPAIDAQHQKLFRMAGDLHNAMGAGKGKDHMAGLLAGLIAYTCEHFAAEEQIMQQHQYPGYSEHHRQHEDLKRQVLDFQQQMEANKVVLTMDLMQFLSDWLSHHIKGSDHQMAAWVMQQRAPVH